MYKKAAALFLALMMVFALVGCKQAQTQSDLPPVSLTEEQKKDSLVEMTAKLEEQLQSADTTAEAEFVVAEDGSCKIISRTTVNDTVSEQEIFSAKSIDEAFQMYYESGFLTQDGAVQGFPEVTKEPASEPTDSSKPTPDEIIASTELSGEDTTIAGFPGEGRLDVGSTSTESTDSEAASESQTESASESISENIE